MHGERNLTESTLSKDTSYPVELTGCWWRGIVALKVQPDHPLKLIKVFNENCLLSLLIV